MAKSSNIEPTITALVKDKIIFKQELEDRIKAGDLLLNGDRNGFKERFLEWTDYNDEYLKHAFNNPKNEYRHDYDYAGFTMIGVVSSHPFGSLDEIENLKYKLAYLRKLLKKADLLKSTILPIGNQEALKKAEVKKTNVFIVHGHDDSAKISTARFIERLGFKAIILHEQASSSKTVIEKIEHYSNVGFAIVLYTACDVGGKTKDELKSRARQNVVFEHGFLIGKIGRENVCAIVKGDIETPNDISGVVYVKMDDDEAWHTKVARELRSSGYDVDMNKL